MDVTATASPDSGVSNAFPSTESLGSCGFGTALMKEVCARAMAWWSMESGLSGQISPECFVPQGRIGAKVPDSVLPPLASHDKRKDTYHGSTNQESQVPTLNPTVAHARPPPFPPLRLPVPNKPA